MNLHRLAGSACRSFTALGLSAGLLAGLAVSPAAEAAVSTTPKPHVVVAVPDTGINPYHAVLYSGSPLYPAAPMGSAPSSVTQPVLDAFGVTPACQIELTRTGNFAADYAADTLKGTWTRARACSVVWFVGTNVLAKSFEPGSIAYMPDSEDDTHGVGTSAAVLAANPEAVLVFIEGTGDEAVSFAMNHPAIDIISTSFGPIGSLPLPGNLTDSYKGVYTNGKMHFGACDNSPSTAIQDSTCGPWWSIGVAGIEETADNEPATSSNGRQPVSGTFPDFIADFTQTLPYCAACEDGYDDYVGGTSFATPRSAGTASLIVLKLRQQFGQTGGIATVDGHPALAVGVVDEVRHTVTNWKLRRALEEAAWVPGIGSYDPVAAMVEFGPGVPIPPVAPWLLIGWGVLTTAPDAQVVDNTLISLGVKPGSLTAKDAGFCNFQNNLIVARQFYWNYVNFGSETFLNPPSPDPYLYCNSVAAMLADSAEPAADADGDGVADGIDNCPNVKNGSQADSDGDGVGDACESATPTDSDGDGVADATDNCPSVANPDQADSNGNGIGDACETPAGNTAPVAALSAPASAVVGQAVSFSGAASSDADGDALSYSFDFGDGTTTPASAQNGASHAYAAAGTYTVKLVVSDGKGGSDSKQASISIEAGSEPSDSVVEAKLSADKTRGEAPMTVAFDASASTGCASGCTYTFNFGDGTQAPAQASPTITHEYTTAGTFSTYVVVGNGDGYNDVSDRLEITTTVSVVVTPGGDTVAQLTLRNARGAAPLQVTFDGSRSIAAGGRTITRYSFDFGDGSAPVSTTQAIVTHVYTTAGTYTPTLTVTDSIGATAQAKAEAGVVAAEPGDSTSGARKGGGGAFGLLTLMPLLLAALHRRRKPLR
jgi:PKD repeat protein